MYEGEKKKKRKERMQTKEVQMERSGEKQRSDMQLSNNQLMHAHASDSACTLR